MISKILQILGLQPRISKVFSRSLEQFFLTVDQNNFGNKIPFPLDRKCSCFIVINGLYIEPSPPDLEVIANAARNKRLFDMYLGNQ